MQRPNINIQVGIEKETPAIPRAHLHSAHFPSLSLYRQRPLKCQWKATEEEEAVCVLYQPAPELAQVLAS